MRRNMKYTTCNSLGLRSVVLCGFSVVLCVIILLHGVTQSRHRVTQRNLLQIDDFSFHHRISKIVGKVAGTSASVPHVVGKVAGTSASVPQLSGRLPGLRQVSRSRREGCRNFGKVNFINF